MNIVLGATGQIGSKIVEVLHKEQKPTVAVGRNHEKLKGLSKLVEARTADFFDVEGLKEAFRGGHTVFLLTPENPASQDVLGETRTILNNYREAIQHAGIKRIVGLSSLGAQHEKGTGNLQMSYMLEHAFEGLQVAQTFIRPAYYFSNWLGYLDLVREQGVLPTFFPVDQKLPMVAPLDVATFAAQVIMEERRHERVYEVAGPANYSSADVADVLGRLYAKEVILQEVPKDQWKDTLSQVGFSDNAAENLMEMTQAVIDGKATPEKEDQNLLKLETSLQEYFEKMMGQVTWSYLYHKAFNLKYAIENLFQT